MKKTIDCLLIGQNEMDFTEHEASVRKMGIHSGAYRNLNKNFIRIDHKLYPVSDAFNLFYRSGNRNPEVKPLKLGETFSAAIAYLGTYLHRRGFTFDYVNCFQEEKEELSNKLAQETIRTIAIITTLYVSPFPIYEIMNVIKKYNQEAKIVIGGPFISTQARTLNAMELEYLFKSIDADFYVNSPQGEAALVRIIEALENNLPVDHINNIYYKTGNGYASTPIQPEQDQLSENMVNWELFSHRVGEYVDLRTSISCPFKCTFCGFPEHAGKFQNVGVEKIERELNQLQQIESVKYLNFIDDTFNVPQKRFKDILRMMIKNRYDFKWQSHFRCQFADREMIELMKESGCIAVFLGLESGNNRILKNMNKAAAVEKYLEGIALLKEYGMVTHGSFIVGFPGETEKTVMDSIQLIEESGIDFYRSQLWYCETITPIWKERETYKIKGSQYEWTHETMDAKTAADLVDKMFLSIDTSVWVPQYHFEFYHLVHLLQREIPIETVNAFLTGFNNGVREKLLNPNQKMVSSDVIREIKRACEGNGRSADLPCNKEKLLSKYDAGFAF